MTVDVAIIGGGVSGLATAVALTRQGRRVVVLERQVTAGGNARSERIGGFLIERGPSAIAAVSSRADAISGLSALAEGRCGLGEDVRRRYLVRQGRLHGTATHQMAFLTSDLLSVPGRLRLMAETVVPRRRGTGGETVAEFASRRFGREFADRVVDPLVGGVYAGRSDELSVSAVFPALVALEREFGSVALGAIRRHLRGGRMPGSRLYSWRNGIGTLPLTLARELGAAVRTGVAVNRIRSRGTGFAIDVGPAGEVIASTVVLATQPHVAAQILEPIDPEGAAATGGIVAPPLAVVFLGFRRSEVAHPLDGLGFLSPTSEGRFLNGAQFCSTMFPGRSPDGYVSIAVYFGGGRAPELGDRPAEELVDLARAELRDLIGADGRPVLARAHHWPRGLPQYRLGHEDLIAQIRTIGHRQPGLFVTGNYLGGISVAACLDGAVDTADRVVAFLEDRKTREPVISLPSTLPVPSRNMAGYPG